MKHDIDICDRDSCWTLPAEFVRLRYFFGQRLGVVDLTDEQAYAIGKSRFHNRHAHGVGVMCGLTGERYPGVAAPPPATKTTLLKVRRGAALDACGREIIVGWDQCIDVNAWFQQNRTSNPDLADWLDPSFTGSRDLWICVQYAECPSDPAPAPRDPCGCDPGGCDYGRVREGFRLSLLTASQLDSVAALPPWPPVDLRLDEGAPGTAVRWANAVSGAACPDATDACLALAQFSVSVDLTLQSVTDIGTVDNTIDRRLALLPTSTLQRALLTALSSTGLDVLGDGPSFGAVTFTGTSATAGTLAIAVELAGATPATLVPLAPSPLASAKVSVWQFADDGTWTDVTPAAADITYVAAAPARFELHWNDGLVDQGRYRVVIESEPARPIVDMGMRPLTPSRFVRQLRLSSVGGTLALSPTLYEP
jgi:hypothetical protein